MPPADKGKESAGTTGQTLSPIWDSSHLLNYSFLIYEKFVILCVLLLHGGLLCDPTLSQDTYVPFLTIGAHLSAMISPTFTWTAYSVWKHRMPCSVSILMKPLGCAVGAALPKRIKSLL